MGSRLGLQTIVLPSRPLITGCAAFVGKKEGEGPLGACFDYVTADEMYNQQTFELAEKQLYLDAIRKAVEKGGSKVGDVQFLLGGDLLNQIIAASLSAREMHIPFLGLYGACSTMAESILLASMLTDGGYMRRALCTASSHFCSAERQYRFPLEYGCQRPPTAQWTVTGAGSLLISGLTEDFPRAIARIPALTPGRIVDLGVTDANNMGAAMAPAAADTLCRHFEDTGTSPSDFDLIISGDLGRVGHDVLLELMQQKGHPLDESTYIDCGLEVFTPEQDVHAGGSGCGCSAVVLCSRILHQMENHQLRRVLFMATGALLSTTSSQQGGTIPGIAHAAVLEAPDR